MEKQIKTDSPHSLTPGILVVDDTPDNLRLLVGILKEKRYSVRPVRDGHTALMSARSHPPDLILLDILMPEMDGYEVCRQLKADVRTQNIPVIFVSALDEVFDKVKAFEVGGVDYITKPFQPEEVLARINNHLTISCLQKQLEVQNVQLQQEIAERARVEEELRKAKEQADAANKAKSAFLANMSHELRTPLTGILGYVEILKYESSVTPLQEEGLDIIEQSGNHLLTLINDVLDLAKIEAGRTELYQADFHLPALLKEVSEMTRIRTQRKDMTFHMQDEQLPTFVYGDKKRLRQILINLLGNAVKFTDSGSVTFRVKRVDALNDLHTQTLRFEIEDTGIGIEPEHLKRIFKPFEQAGDPKRRVEGTGLGLAICRHLIHLMGSELYVRSTPGNGSTFWFDLTLPVISLEEETPAREKPQIIGILGEAPPLLIVDDQWQIRQVFRNVLESKGFQIIEASSGQEALIKASEYHPAGLIIDLMVPGMDGLELIRRIRHTPELSETIIIATSVRVFEEDRQKSFEAGCNAFHPKPINPPLLFEQLQEHLMLEWIYKDAPPEHFHASPSIIPPSQQELAILLRTIKLGDIQSLRQHIERLEHSDPQLKPFLATLRQLTKKFLIDEIRQFIESFRTEE